VAKKKSFYILVLKIVALNVEFVQNLIKVLCKFHGATKDAIKYITLAPPKKLFSFNISSNCVKELELVAKIYLNEKLEKDYKLEELF
jgi:hypothetical protein